MQQLEELAPPYMYKKKRKPSTPGPRGVGVEMGRDIVVNVLPYTLFH